VRVSEEISEQLIRQLCEHLLRPADAEAARLHHDFIGTEHLYMALTQVSDSLAERLLHTAGLDPRDVRNAIRRDAGMYSSSESEPLERPFTPRACRVLRHAVQIAERHDHEMVDERHLLLALLREGKSIPMRRLRLLGVDLESWIDFVEDQMHHLYPPDGFELPDSNYEISIYADEARPVAAQQGETPTLDRYGRDLTKLAREGKLSPVIGREREIRMMTRTLMRTKKNNPLLVGDAGVGKTAIVEGLAYNIAQGSVPAMLRNRRLVQIEMGTLLAGTSLRGQFEERLTGIVEEVRANPEIILFIDEIHTIVGAGDTMDSNLDAANILKPALSRGEITCIGATTHEEYRAAIAQDPALERRFRVIEIGEPSAADTLLILTSVQDSYAKHHGVQIQSEALHAAVALSSKYLYHRRQPDKALDLLDEACARAATQTAHGADLNAPRIVTAETVAEVLAEWTGIPVVQLTEDERRKYARMEATLRARVVGQDHVISAVAGAVRASRAGLSNPNRPVGVFLFLGPSGVGKTELAKALAEFLFGSENALLRFDMSEFYDEHTLARLIGAPPGYLDTKRGGQLTEALRRHPYRVILLDEVEKAAPPIFDLFLQVFDEGRLTDARGNVVDARHAVWIMTSNIGTAELMHGKVGFARSPATTADYQAALRHFFRPEFLNRLDEVLIFNPLTEETLNQILDLQLNALRLRLQDLNLELQLTPEARAFLLQHGYDAVNGARPLRRAIERYLTRPLSAQLLERPDFQNGAIVVHIADDHSHLTFAIKPHSASRETQ
jgi:ATP-dependent Clp protease ATP-binding subunit ClpC